MTTHTLATVAQGDATAASAKKIISAALKSNEEGVPGRIYDALRSFVTLVLVERRGEGDELAAWADLMKRTRFALAKNNAKEAEWLVPLSDMVGDAIGFSENYRLVEIVRRAHIREILSTLRDHQDAAGSNYVARNELQRRTNLKDANLSKVIGTLIHHGLVERRKNGQTRSYELTMRGRNALKALPPSPSERHGQPDLTLDQASVRVRVSGRSREPSGQNRPVGEPVPLDFEIAFTAPRKESFVKRAAPKTKRAATKRKAHYGLRVARAANRHRMRSRSPVRPSEVEA